MTLSFCALSFFLTQQALYYIPITQNLSPNVITGISAGSAFSSLFSEIFSKNMDLNNMLDKGTSGFFSNGSKSKLIYTHSIMAIIFTLTMAVSYYTGCMNLSEDTGLDKWMPEEAWWTILTYSLFAISGGALELAFSVKPMFESIATAAAIPVQNEHDPYLEAPTIEEALESSPQGTTDETISLLTDDEVNSSDSIDSIGQQLSINADPQDSQSNTIIMSTIEAEKISSLSMFSRPRINHETNLNTQNEHVSRCNVM